MRNNKSNQSFYSSQSPSCWTLIFNFFILAIAGAGASKSKDSLFVSRVDNNIFLFESNLMYPNNLLDFTRPNFQSPIKSVARAKACVEFSKMIDNKEYIFYPIPNSSINHTVFTTLTMDQIVQEHPYPTSSINANIRVDFPTGSICHAGKLTQPSDSETRKTTFLDLTKPESLSEDVRKAQNKICKTLFQLNTSFGDVTRGHSISFFFTTNNKKENETNSKNVRVEFPANSGCNGPKFVSRL